MRPQARVIWDSLEFRTPAILRAVEQLSHDELHWPAPNGGNSVAWLLWHIAEVEDNWIRSTMLGLPKRYPFGGSVKDAASAEFPDKDALLAYFHEVRALTRERLMDLRDDDFDGNISDEHFGVITIRQVWAGVVTSCAWHGGQIVLIANRLLLRVGWEDERD